jgi:hypothetical protein
VASEPAELLDRLAAYAPPTVTKWTELEGGAAKAPPP